MKVRTQLKHTPMD